MKRPTKTENSALITRRSVFYAALCALLLALAPFTEAQQLGKIPRIGYLVIGAESGKVSEAFLQGLRDLGYVEGKNIIIEYRGDPQRREDRLPELAGDLVRLKVDVIVALSPPAARAAINATKTIPIVIRSTGDPVEAGLVASLAQPGGNITGVTSVSSELYGKRLELLKEVIPRLSRVAVLRDPGRSASDYEKMQSTARSLNLQPHSVEVRAPKNFENAFRAAAKARAQALITIRTPLINDQRKQVVDLAIKNRLPAIYDERQYVEANGLMSYGTNLAELQRHAAVFVDKILKGRKPADLPVEQPMKFEFVINLNAAQQIGLTVPPAVVAQADKVIR